MKKLLYVLFLTPIFTFSQEFKIDHKRNDDKTVNFRYQKSKPNSITAILVFSFMSNTSSSRTIIQKLSKSQGSFITLKPTNADENIGFNYTYKYFNQTINPTLDEDFVYILPYKKGTKMNVEELDYLGEKYSNKKKPKGWKAYSFKSDVSQEIYPTRRGVVIEVVNKHEPDLTKTYSFYNKMNSVKVEHGDGTIANYSGFDKLKISVKPGDIVYPQINKLGETTVFDNRGFHLINFSISYIRTISGVNISNLKNNEQLEYIYVSPVFFENGETIVLKKGFPYISDFDEETLFQNFSKRQIKKYKKGKPID
tara:strand:- start:546 stop:1475 length:930 start_codon:yes stop_codon:yes gene_type:complete